MYQLLFLRIALIALGIMFIVALGYGEILKGREGGAARFSSRETPSATLVSASLYTGWKEYSDASLSFKYPPSLSVEQQGSAIVLRHHVAHRHPDACDFKGDAPALDRITDFNTSFRVIEKGLKDAISLNEGSDYIVRDFLKNDNTLTLSKGFIDAATIGSLHGYQITSGVEGCGRYTYYFPLSPEKTLAVSRAFVPEFNSINMEYQTYLAVPGIIPPSQEKEFFKKILMSLAVK